MTLAPEPVEAGKCAECGHPLTAHTGTQGTFPWRKCARTGCACWILVKLGERVLLVLGHRRQRLPAKYGPGAQRRQLAAL